MRWIIKRGVGSPAEMHPSCVIRVPDCPESFSTLSLTFDVLLIHFKEHRPLTLPLLLASFFRKGEEGSDFSGRTSSSPRPATVPS